MRVQKQPPEYSKQAKKYLESLDAKNQQRIKKSIEKIPDGDIRKYISNPDYSRLRVGDYRILFKWVSDTQILVAVIDSRGQSYKKGI
ncbi:MAG: type II toxin-antitoxin system RelE/ParE family toxin [Defluviitaleaceae bacterium]|nr:type II toxin-antitoxin system RelE/ParE family toxin [Defluviitaleaceae bacterium]